MWNRTGNNRRDEGGPVLRDPRGHNKNRTLPYYVNHAPCHRQINPSSFSNSFSTKFCSFPSTPNEILFPSTPTDSSVGFANAGANPFQQQQRQPFLSQPPPLINEPPIATTPPSLLGLPVQPWQSSPNATGLFNQNDFKKQSNSMRPSHLGNSPYQSGPGVRHASIPALMDSQSLIDTSVPPPLLSFPAEQPLNSSPGVAVFTNDEQPPFAFPDRKTALIPRNPNPSKNLSSKLMEFAYGGADAGGLDSNDDNTSYSGYNNKPLNFSNNLNVGVRSTSNDHPSFNQNHFDNCNDSGLIKNPFFGQDTVQKPRESFSIPNWLEDGHGETEYQKPSFTGKKKQSFDWKGSFLNKFNNTPGPPRNRPNQSYESKAPANFSNNNHPHPKSCVRNFSPTNNNANTTQKSSPMNKAPLLPTPKLIPYPPPPLPNTKSELTTMVSRVPKGILKPLTSYTNNFVAEGANDKDSSEDINSSVVPYDDDDEDDIEFIQEVAASQESGSESTSHDFFSEKLVQHMLTVLKGKPIETQMDELLNYLVLSPDFLSTRVSIVRNLHLMLTETFKKSQLYPYGADFIGFGNSDDSVNVFVDLNGKNGASSTIEGSNINPTDLTKENIEELLSLIQEDKNHKFFGQIVRRTNFNAYRNHLPVISFIHCETKVRCNIRMDNYLLVQEAKIVQFLCSLDTRLPPIMAILRYWSSVHKVLDTPEEDTKNRFVTLLMLFFLAHKKIIPTMAHLQSLSIKPLYFENMDISFCNDTSLVPPNENAALEDRSVFCLSVLSLLKQFFIMFANAKFEEDVVSLWKAEFIPKENFSPNVEVKVLAPDLRKKYRFGADGNLRDRRIDCGNMLCIQDFQDLTENLALAIASYDVQKFQIECEIAHKKIDDIILGSGNLMELFVITEYADSVPPNVSNFLRRASATND